MNMGKIQDATRIFLTTLFCFFSAFQLTAQESLLDQPVYLDEQTGSVDSVLTKIAGAGHFTFSYSNKVPTKKYVSIKAGNRTVREILDELFSGEHVEYAIKKNKILLIDKSGAASGSKVYGLLRGRIYDSDTEMPLIGANVVIITTEDTVGTVTDLEGSFTLPRIPVGRHELRVSYLGYMTKVIPELLISSAKELIQDIPLTESVYEMAEVTLPASRKSDPMNEMTVASARSFTVEETKRFPAAVNDPSRMVLIFPGVKTAAEDISNEISIRGNAPNYLQWRLEGVEIPNPNHFNIEGTTSGFVNILGANLLDKSDFLTGAFPAEYGNALSAVFDLSMRNGNDRKREYSLQAGLMGADLAAEGPFHRDYNGSYLFNVRYSMLDVLTRMGVSLPEDLKPIYQDISYKIHAPTKKAGDFSLWGIGGRAVATTKDTGKTEYNTYTTRTIVLGLTHLYPVNERSYLKSVVSYSQNISTDEEVDFEDTTVSDGRIRYDTLSFSALRASVFYKYKLNEKFSFKVGGIASLMLYGYKENHINTQRVVLDTIGNTCLFQGFVQGKYKFSQNLFLTAGIHSMYFGLTGAYSIEPRLGIKWQFAENHSIGFGYGKHSRHEVLSMYFHRVHETDTTFSIPNTKLDLTKSDHYVVSYENSMIKNLYFKTEVFYQHLYDVLRKSGWNFTQAPINGDFPVDTFLNEGTARNYGIEFMFDKTMSNGYYILGTVTYFDSKFNPKNDKWYHTKYDAGFIHNLVGGKEFSLGKRKRDLLGINGKIIWAGGYRGQRFDSDEQPVRGDKYEVQYPDYFRMDASLSYRINRTRMTHIISCDLQNITRHKNVFNVEPGNETSLDILLPFFNYRIEF